MECQYKHSTTFGDEVEITVGVEEFKGVRLVIGYTMIHAATGNVVLTGKTRHCFTDTNGKPIILKKRFPEIDSILRDLASDRNAP